MNRLGLVLLIFLAVTGCNRAKPVPAAAYRGWLDKSLAALGIDGLFYTACTQTDANGVTNYIPQNCYVFETPQRMRGLWRRGFETNDFARNATPSSPRTVLNYARNERIYGDLPFEKIHCGMRTKGCVFSIEFIGRRTAYPVLYGDKITYVDRLLKFEPVVARPSILTDGSIGWFTPD